MISDTAWHEAGRSIFTSGDSSRDSRSARLENTAVSPVAFKHMTGRRQGERRADVVDVRPSW
jgi:hypothetical protein